MTAYGPLSAFASCPAATGESLLSPCPGFPDGAHRCALARDHPRDMAAEPDTAGRLMHRCGCGYDWTCLPGSIETVLRAGLRASS